MSTESSSATLESYDSTSTYYRNPIVPNEFKGDASQLKAIYQEIRMLILGAEAEGETVPTPFAICQAFEQLEQVAYATMHLREGMRSRPARFPKGYVSTDDHGGIRIDWRSGRAKSISLVVGHNDEAPSYVFVKKGPGDRGQMLQPIHTIQFATLLADFASSVECQEG